MNLVSNQEAYEDEYLKLIEARKHAKEKPITMSLVWDKMVAIKNAKEYDYGAEDIEQMVNKNL